MPTAGIKHQLDITNHEFWEGVAKGFQDLASQANQAVIDRILKNNEIFKCFITKLPEVD